MRQGHRQAVRAGPPSRRSLGNGARSIRSWAFSPDGKYVATATGLGLKEDSDYTCIGDIRVWDAKTGRLVATVPARLGYVKRVAFREDGKTVEYSAFHFNIDGP